jgi:hypothetical protein
MKVLRANHLWVPSQSSAYSSAKVYQSSVVTGKELQYIPSPNILDLSLESSQSSVHFNGMQSHRQPSEGFLDMSTSTTSPLLFCLGYDVKLLEQSFLSFPQIIILVMPRVRFYFDNSMSRVRYIICLRFLRMKDDDGCCNCLDFHMDKLLSGIILHASDDALFKAAGVKSDFLNEK